MQHQTDDVRISEIKELLPPVAVLEKFPGHRDRIQYRL